MANGSRVRRIGILTGGGDAPGLNPAIKWVVKGLMEDGDYQVIGIKDGWQGLHHNYNDKVAHSFGDFRDNDDIHFVKLNPLLVRSWDRDGGTNLGTSRTNPYSDLEIEGGAVLPREHRVGRLMDNISMLRLDGIVSIGGEDTQSVAAKLSKDGVDVVGIPKTIDRDLPETDYTLGFATAVNVITDCVDRLRTTAGSHKRLFVVETMGRHAGHLALQGGMASGAHVILIPEIDYEFDRIDSLVESYRKSKGRYVILVASEGAKEKGGEAITVETKDTQFSHVALGGIGKYLEKKLEQRVDYEVRSQPLSHLQRGGIPIYYDRLMGRSFGLAAANLIIAGRKGVMVNLKDSKVGCVELDKVLEDIDAGRLNTVDVDREYDRELYNGSRRIIS